MKQYITKEQWDELSEEQKDQWALRPADYTGQTLVDNLPNIGQMIEFLGEDLMHFTKMVTFVDNTANWAVEKVLEDTPKYAVSVRDWEHLVDALWEAVKVKLNQTKDE